MLYVGEAIERERVRDIFSRFVPGDVVEEVLASTDENLRLGGVELDCTVLFSDLRGFTSFSETQPAARVIEVVNHYLNEMTEAILDAGGTLVSYMGDGIMAVFGAPLEQPDHADRALVAAREMVGIRLDRFNAWLAEQGFGRSFEMGVGLNSGTVMAGNVGSEQRVEYTAIGDTTNTASRLEGLTKNSEAMLFISSTTRERLAGGAEDLVEVGEFEIRGREQKLTVWTIRAAPAGCRAPPRRTPPAGGAPPSKPRTGHRRPSRDGLPPGRPGRPCGRCERRHGRARGRPQRGRDAAVGGPQSAGRGSRPTGPQMRRTSSPTLMSRSAPGALGAGPWRGQRGSAHAQAPRGGGTGLKTACACTCAGCAGQRPRPAPTSSATAVTPRASRSRAPASARP